MATEKKLQKGELPEELKVTSLDDLKSYAEGQIIELPPFAEGQEFIVKLRRPSMLMMMKANLFPNELLTVANSLFVGTAAGEIMKDPETLRRSTEVFIEVAKRALVAPTYSDLEAAGMELTDEQLTFIFNYSQDGVKFLSQFRNQ